MKATTTTSAMFTVVKPTIIDRIKGLIWRINFRINRHIMSGFEWAMYDEEAEPKRIVAVNHKIEYVYNRKSK